MKKLLLFLLLTRRRGMPEEMEDFTKEKYDVEK